jgi:hypothetical protein
MQHFIGKFLLPTLTMVLFVTCKSEDPEPSLLYLSKVTTELHTREYTFDGGKATGSTYTEGATKVTATFTYNGDGDITNINYSDDTHEAISYLNGNIIGRKRYDTTKKLLSQWDYEYSGIQLTKVQYYEVADGIPYAAGHIVYEYDDTAGNDPAQVKEFLNHTPTTPSTSVYTYDQTKGAFSAAPAALKKYFRVLNISTEKNVVKIVNDTKTWNYTYEFNDSGYPTKRVGGPSTGQAFTTSYDYTLVN